MRYLKTLTYQNIEYALYERKLPREFTFYAGQGQNAPMLIANVVNINNETSPATILDITTSQSCSLDVLPSDYLDKDEPIKEPSELAELSGQVNAINGILPTKQDKTDYSLETTNKTVVGAINENKSKIELNTANIESNREDIAKNREAIDGLNENLATGQDYIGTITTNTVPTEQTLNNFVLEERSIAPKGGDTIIVILQVSGDTDRNFKYIYNGTQWTYYEIPPMEQASNGTHGIIEGTYGIGLNNNTLVDISGGQILNIYVKDKDGDYQNIQTYLNMNAQDIEDIINGDSVVGESIKAMQDGLGNNIANTYLTQVLGATKQFVRDYAQPREFGNVYFISADGYSKQVPTTPESGVQFSVNTSAVASFQMFQIEKTNEASFELTSINGYSNNLYISASADCDVQYRLTTEYKKSGEDWNTLNVELSNVIPMRAGNIQRVQLNSPFTALGDNVVSLVTGDKIRQTLAVVTQTSSPLVFNLYSNEIYPSTFTITSQSYILEDIDKAKSQIILIGADGVLESGNVVMTVQNSENFVEYRTNQREFLLDGNIPVVGEINPTYPIRIAFGETVYNLYSFMKGGNNPLTFGDIASSTTYNTNMGYSFDIRVMFIETSDIMGFVLSPSTLTAEQITNIVGEDGSVVATIGSDGKVILTLDNTLQNKLMKALVAPMTAPSNFELVGIDSSNSQAMVDLGDRFVVENDEINLSDETIKTLDFAEAERQENKNLWYSNKAIDIVTAGLSVKFTPYNQKIVYNGTTDNYSYFTINSDVFLKAGTYTISIPALSGTRTEGVQQAYVYFSVRDGFIALDVGGHFTFTLDQDQYLTSIGFQSNSGITYTNYTFGIQVEKGSVATDYQPYNGSIERVEVVYDMDGGTPLNWGKTNGIYGGDVISGKDFRKYKKLIVYSYSSGNILTTIIPLTNLFPGVDSYIGCNAGLSNDATDLQCIKCSVNGTKNDFEVDVMGYYGTSGFVPRNNTHAYVVFKIEGVY
jgi:hypothetical protein